MRDPSAANINIQSDKNSVKYDYGNDTISDFGDVGFTFIFSDSAFVRASIVGNDNYVKYKYGNDYINGGTGNDQLVGDIIDTLVINDLGTNNTVELNYGNDVLTGGDGNDSFDFRVGGANNDIGQGKDKITDMTTDDVLIFNNVQDVDGTAGLSINDLEQGVTVTDNGTNVKIKFNADSSEIKLLGIGTGSIDSFADLDAAGFGVAILP